jgi:hypothetical protein
MKENGPSAQVVTGQEALWDFHPGSICIDLLVADGQV